MDLKRALKEIAHLRIHALNWDSARLERELARASLPFASTEVTEGKWRCVDLASSDPGLDFFVDPFDPARDRAEQFASAVRARNPALSEDRLREIVATSTPRAQRAYLNHFFDLERRMSGALRYREGLPAGAVSEFERLREYLRFDRVLLTEMLPGCEMTFHSHYEFEGVSVDYSHALVHLPLITNPRCLHEVLFDDERLACRHYPAGEFWLFNAWLRHRAVNLGETIRRHLIFFVDIEKNARLLGREWESHAP